MGDRLTDAQQTAFTENGYLVLDGLLDAGECSALRDEVDALVRQRVLGEQPLVEEVNAKAPAMGLTAAAATRTCTTPVTSSTSAASGHRCRKCKEV
jgi:hypothetical protein